MVANLSVDYTLVAPYFTKILTHGVFEENGLFLITSVPGVLVVLRHALYGLDTGSPVGT